MSSARSDPWKSGWLLPWLAVALLWLAHAATGCLQPLERWWCDRVLATVPRAISSEVVLVTIDDSSLTRVGRWPWSREVHARLIDRLTEVGARVVVYNVPFVGAEAEDALSQLHRIAATVAADPSLAVHPRLPGLLAQSEDLLDADARLARSLNQNGRTLLIADQPASGRESANWPLATLAAGALGVAPQRASLDDDGMLRRVPLRVKVDGRAVPTPAVWAAVVSRGGTPASVRGRDRTGFAGVGPWQVPVDRQEQFRPVWRSPTAKGGDFVRVSAADVLKTSGPDARLAGKLVFVGLTAAAQAPSLALPGSGALFPVEIAAQTASALLTGQWVQTPVASALFEASLVAIVALYLLVVLPRLSTGSAVALSALLGVTLLVAGHVALAQGLWVLPVILPVTALVIGHLCAWAVARHASWGSAPASTAAQLNDKASRLDGHLASTARPSRMGRTLSPALPRLGRFQIVRELARGAMGRIYAAHELETMRPVALKTLALSREFQGVALQEARERFRREAMAASRLHHPDIVRLIDAGEDQGLAYIAMELLSGENLDRHTRRHDLLPVPTVLEVTARIAEALHYAHRQGVVHRDIKPANIMLDLARGQVSITDFGVARVVDAARTRTGVILGSPSYMSPEQLIGRAVDGRSDLYSLGVLCFQLLTGSLPYEGGTMAALIDAVVNQPAPDVRSLRPRLPEAVANIVSLALEKRPELRYADCQQMAADLRAVGALWRQAVGPRPEALSGDWASPSEFAEAQSLAPATRHKSLHVATS